jgi:polysaccharide export outer membrane protein
LIHGVDCAAAHCCASEPTWNNWQLIPWQVFAQGEYIGPHRIQDVPEYRVRVDDDIEFIYRLTRGVVSKAYELSVGDVIVIESMTDETLNRGDLRQGTGLEIQPDGTITLRLLGQVQARGRTVEQLRTELEERYKKYYKIPAITVTPVKVNTTLEDLRDAVDGRFGEGGQRLRVRVTPEGTIQLPAIGSFPVHGLSIPELKMEIDERYAQIVDGLEVTPVLSQRAPRFVYVLGEVVSPGRYTLEGPTSAMQSIALAGGWINGGNLHEIVVFRRAEDWRLLATKLDLHGAMLGKRPCPADEIWLRDSDIVLIPKTPLRLTSDWIHLVFTQGIYGAVPLNASVNVTSSSRL